MSEFCDFVTLKRLSGIVHFLQYIGLKKGKIIMYSTYIPYVHFDESWRLEGDGGGGYI